MSAIDVTLNGINKHPKLVHPEKASASIDLIDFGILIRVRLIQLEKHLDGITSIVLGIVISDRYSLFLKLPDLIVVTLAHM